MDNNNLFGSLIPQQGQSGDSAGTAQGNQPGVSDPNNLFGSLIPQAAPPSHMDQAIASLQALKQGDHAGRFQAISDSGNSINAQTMAFIDTFNKQMGDLPRGIMQIAGLGDVHADGGLSVNQQQAMSQRDAELARQQHPIAAGLGDVAGFTGNAINATALGSGLMGAGAAASGLDTGLAAGSGIGNKVTSGLAAIGERVPGLQSAGNALATGAEGLAQNSPMLAKMGQSALQNGAWAGAQATAPDQSHLSNAIGGAALGSVIPPGMAVAGDALSRVGNTLPGRFVADAYGRTVPGMTGYLNKVFNPDGAAAEDLGATLKKYGVTPATLQADMAPANRIGASLSLGEGLNNTNNGIAAIEGRMGSGDLASAKIANEHLNDLKDVIGSQVENISKKLVPEGPPDKVAAQITKGFEDLKGVNIPTEDLAALTQNPALRDYLNSANKSSLVPQDIQKLPDTNVAKLAYVARQINGDLYKNTSSITKDAMRPLSGDESAALLQAKQSLQSTISNVAPDYTKLMDLSQRNIQRNQLAETLNNAVKGQRNMKPDGTMETSIESLYNNLWKTPEQQDKFIDIVKKAGGDPQVAQDIMYTANHAINTPIQKILSGTRVAAETNKESADKLGVIKQAWNALTTNEYNNALLKLSLGGAPAQAEIIAAMHGASLGDKIVALNKALGDVSGKAVVNAGVNGINIKK